MKAEDKRRSRNDRSGPASEADTPAPDNRRTIASYEQCAAEYAWTPLLNRALTIGTP